MHEFISQLGIFLDPYIFLFLCQDHVVLMTLALEYSLKSEKLIPLVPPFFLKIALAVRGLVFSHTNYKIICSSSLKNAIGNLIEMN